MSNNKNIDNNYNQELTLEFKLDNRNFKLEDTPEKEASYSFTVKSEYTNDNISFKYSVKYNRIFYSKNITKIFGIKENEANKIYTDIKNSIIKNIENLNPIVKQETPIFDTGLTFGYKIDLSFNDNENVFSKINLENLLNSIISVFKNRNIDIEMEEKPLNELTNEKEITILLNNKDLEIKINKTEDGKLDASISYDKIDYKINLSFEKEDSYKLYIDYFIIIYGNIFNNYYRYLDFLENIKNPNRFFDKIINPIFQNESIIRENIKVYGFNEALEIIDKLEYFDRVITRKLIEKFNWENEFKSDIIRNIKC